MTLLIKSNGIVMLIMHLELVKSVPIPPVSTKDLETSWKVFSIASLTQVMSCHCSPPLLPTDGVSQSAQTLISHQLDQR